MLFPLLSILPDDSGRYGYGSGSGYGYYGSGSGYGEYAGGYDSGSEGDKLKATMSGARRQRGLSEDQMEDLVHNTPLSSAEGIQQELKCRLSLLTKKVSCG